MKFQEDNDGMFFKISLLIVGFCLVCYFFADGGISVSFQIIGLLSFIIAIVYCVEYKWRKMRGKKNARDRNE